VGVLSWLSFDYWGNGGPKPELIALAGATITRKTTTFPTQHVSFNIIIFLFKNNLLRRILMYLIHFCMEILEPFELTVGGQLRSN
jgi:hypothetical protein